MTLAAGSRIGSYDVIALLGVGGMGEVYRARDTTLNRDVAVKVLPAAVASDPDRLARFRREAEALAALNHPGIAQIYGFESAGTQPAIVMELVDGEDLSACIARGPMPVDDVLAVARQIAEAMDAAHARGIVHRDLKPANVKVAPDGRVKVLDFGLAKAMDPPQAAGELANSPTLTGRATTLGVILGTAAYMAPEQAKGRPVDRRADIWAFGAVLFEMVSGRRAFDGDDFSEVLAAVIKSEPPWAALPAHVPPALQRLLRRCLEKDPGRRLRDIAEGMLQLDEGLAQVMPPPPAAAASRRWAAAAIGIALVAAVAAGWSASRLLRSAPPPSGPIRFSTVPALSLGPNPRPHVAIAPDDTLIYVGRGGLLAKRPDQYEGELIEGTESATTPVVSPDGMWLAFVQGAASDTLIFKVPIRGGPRTLVTASAAKVYGVDWGPDGTIVYGTLDGLFKVPTGTDRWVRLTTASGQVGGGHSWPSFAGSTGVLLFAIGQEPEMKLAALSLQTEQVTELGVTGTSPRYLSTGHVVFATSDGVLRGAAFDISRLAFTGDAVPLEDRVRVRAVTGAADFAVSHAGTLAYVSADDDVRVPAWVDRNKKESPLSVEARAYTYPRLSRDGSRLVLASRDKEQDVWMWEFAKPGLRTFVRNIGNAMDAAWTADSRAVFLPMARGGRATIQRFNADGSGQPATIIESDRLLAPHAVLPDGLALIVRHGNDLALVNLGGEPKIAPLIAGATNPSLSPDGRWLAYQARQGQSREVVVRPFPRINEGQWPISSGYSWGPIWSPTGKAIFYVSDQSLMRVAVEAGSAFSHDAPQAMFDLSAYPAFGLGRHFDVGPDGRFLMLKRIERVAPTVNIVLSWSGDVATRAKPR